MKNLILSGSILISILLLACSNNNNYTHYLSFSRLTDPKDFSFMLDNLPEDIISICKIAKQQTVHHNLRPYYGIPRNMWADMNTIWQSGAPIPGMRDMLAALKEAEPHNIYDERRIEQRIVGACMLESALLTGLLRYKKIPARIRAGYFKNTMKNAEHVINFWENVCRAKGVRRDLIEEDPAAWKELMNAITMRTQIKVNKHIEHWICEYWDANQGRWRLLDANDTFLKASSGIDVGFHLPREHYEFAFEAWHKMRNTEDFNPDQYQEDPQDGRSHIRSQMLLDFYCLLNHDMVGFNDQSGKAMEFIKGKRYEDTSPDELEELDALSEFMAQAPTMDELKEFYYKSNTLRLEAAEKDPYSFVFSK